MYLTNELTRLLIARDTLITRNPSKQLDETLRRLNEQIKETEALLKESPKTNDSYEF